MKTVKGITKTSLIHNGKYYQPNTEIDIEVADDDYGWLTEKFVTISQTQENETPQEEEQEQNDNSAEEKDVPMLPKGPKRPDTIMAHTQKPKVK